MASLCIKKVRHILDSNGHWSEGNNIQHRKEQEAIALQFYGFFWRIKKTKKKTPLAWLRLFSCSHWIQHTLCAQSFAFFAGIFYFDLVSLLFAFSSEPQNVICKTRARARARAWVVFCHFFANRRLSAAFFSISSFSCCCFALCPWSCFQLL